MNIERVLIVRLMDKSGLTDVTKHIKLELEKLMKNGHFLRSTHFFILFFKSVLGFKFTSLNIIIFTSTSPCQKLTKAYSQKKKN